MLGLLAIVLALLALIALAYRGVTVLLLAPLAALVAVAGAGEPWLASYTQVFMPAAGRFIAAFFPLFLLGAVFGHLMSVTGAAEALARAIITVLGPRRAIPAVVAGCAILTYGGVSLFVVAFAMVPLAQSLFAAARISPRLIPAAVALGAFTFTMTALPGTPAIQNAIPIPTFGTTLYAAPGLGLVASLVMLGLGLLWLERRARSLGSAGVPDAAASPAPAPRPAMAFTTAAAPIALVLILTLSLSTLFYPQLDAGYLAEAKYGATSLPAVAGLWAVITALGAACLWLLGLLWRRGEPLGPALAEGAERALLPAFATASLVGFGAVVASLPAFALVRDAVLGVAPGQPLIALAIAVNLLAAITGSASGGVSIALQSFGDLWVAMAREHGLQPELLHRVVVIATGGLDALPHNGAVVTLLSIAKASHADAYGDIFVVACVIPLIALGVVIVLGSLFGGF